MQGKSPPVQVKEPCGKLDIVICRISSCNPGVYKILSDLINLTQVHTFTASAQDIFTFRRLLVFTVSFTGILQVLMQIMKRFVPSY